MKEEQELEVSLEVPKKEESTEVTLETAQIPLDVEETADIHLDVSETAEIPLDVSVDQEEETTVGFEVCLLYTSLCKTIFPHKMSTLSLLVEMICCGTH